ncbi:hypothetical protein TanjilG_03948 [Lupinus angustifolius]|uniref:Uncharacterized protein n=1 Tax=Lupinus angustifolius TaxID=3871 RepID=A0A4P1RAZ7_LUPAN|nr:hypothetical protein TanjilG_03948 [Lupinus angustifolius]
MSLLHAGFLDEVVVLKGFLISPNARITVSVKKVIIGTIGHAVEARRTHKVYIFIFLNLWHLLAMQQLDMLHEQWQVKGSLGKFVA